MAPGPLHWLLPTADNLEAIYPLSHFVGYRSQTITESLQPGDEGYRRFHARFHYVSSLSWLDYTSRSTPERVAPKEEEEAGPSSSSSSSAQEKGTQPRRPWYRHKVTLAIWTRFKLILHSAIGSFAILVWIALISRKPYWRNHRSPIVLASYGTECVLVFCLPHLPSSQPASIVIGNTVSAIIATAIAQGFDGHQPSFNPGSVDGVNWAAPAIAQMVAQAVMQSVGITHPPGAALAVLAATNPSVEKGVNWQLPPQVLIISLLFVAWGLLVNNVGGRRWPMTWWWAPFYPSPPPPHSIAERVKGKGKDWAQQHGRGHSRSQSQAQSQHLQAPSRDEHGRQQSSGSESIA